RFANRQLGLEYLRIRIHKAPNDSGAQPRRVLCAGGCSGLFSGFLGGDPRRFSRIHSCTRFDSFIPSPMANPLGARASLAVSATATVVSFRRKKTRVETSSSSFSKSVRSCSSQNFASSWMESVFGIRGDVITFSTDCIVSFLDPSLDVP